VVFTDPHKLLTVFGTSFSGAETWSFGVRCLQLTPTPVTQAMADACRTPTSTLWSTAGLFMPSSHVLEGVKLAPIGVDGNYPPGQISYIGDITPTAGPSNTNIHPAQCAQVVTFLSDLVPRGRGSHGRIYMPLAGAAVSAANGTNGLASALATAVRTWIVALNAISGLGIVSIMSNLGTGQSSPVATVRADSLPDTQRRRRRQLTSATTSVAV